MTRGALGCGVACLHRVSRTYPSQPPNEVLRDVELIVHEGDFVTIVGPSGAGKSTLVNLLGLLDTPTSGVVHTRGRSIEGMGDAERSAIRGAVVGFVFQAFHLMDRRSVLGNVSLSGAYHGVGRQVREERAREALDRVGLANRSSAQAWTLSGGERQRTALARALAGRPAVLLCDEPTGNLDPDAAKQVVTLLHQSASRGIAVVVITHDHSVAAQGTRRFELSDGMLQELP